MSGGEREGQRIRSGLYTNSRESESGLDLTNHEVKSAFNWQSHPGKLGRTILKTLFVICPNVMNIHEYGDWCLILV